MCQDIGDTEVGVADGHGPVSRRATDVAAIFTAAIERYGTPASVLTDNGCIYTARYRGGKVVMETLTEALGVTYKHSSPYHPQPRTREVVMLIADRDIRVITPDGELLRQLTLDPTRDYQPQSAGWISTMS